MSILFQNPAILDANLPPQSKDTDNFIRLDLTWKQTKAMAERNEKARLPLSGYIPRIRVSQTLVLFRAFEDFAFDQQRAMAKEKIESNPDILLSSFPFSEDDFTKESLALWYSSRSSSGDNFKAENIGLWFGRTIAKGVLTLNPNRDMSAALASFRSAFESLSSRNPPSLSEIDRLIAAIAKYAEFTTSDPFTSKVEAKIQDILTPKAKEQRNLDFI